MSPFNVMAAGLLAAVLPTVAAADLTFCNRTAQNQSVAIGYKDGEIYISRGWWNLDPEACKVVLSGDLKRRYYYFRTETRGVPFENAEYPFCVSDSAFRIDGDTGCAARGYDERLFRRLDTGKTARDFTHDIRAEVSPPGRTAPEPAPAPAPRAEGFAPGTYGEPYTDNVTFQGCISSEGMLDCGFVGNLTGLHLYDDGRTPASVIDRLRSTPPATPMTVSGDMTGIFDTTAEIVLNSAKPRDRTNADLWLEVMQGGWYSTDDANVQITVLGAEMEETYDGAVTARSYMSIQGTCDDAPGPGNFLVTRDSETGDMYCYALDDVTALDWRMNYMPRGNPLQYRRLD